MGDLPLVLGKCTQPLAAGVEQLPLCIQVVDELRHEEGIALRLFVDRLRQVRRRLAAAHPAQYLLKRRDGQSPQRDVTVQLKAAELCEGRQQVVQRRKVLVPAGGQDKDRRSREAGRQVSQEQAARRVRPLQVFDEEQDGTAVS